MYLVFLPIKLLLGQSDWPMAESYAINNYVYEDGDYTSNEGVRMYLRMSPTSGSGMMDGHWSPDYAYESGVTYV